VADGVCDAPAVGVDEDVAEIVGVRVGSAVSVGVAPRVGVGSGVSVEVGSGVSVGLGVRVALEVLVGVTVGVRVGLGVRVAVTVGVRVGLVRVGVAVVEPPAVGVGSGVSVGSGVNSFGARSTRASITAPDTRSIPWMKGDAESDLVESVITATTAADTTAIRCTIKLPVNPDGPDPIRKRRCSNRLRNT